MVWSTVYSSTRCAALPCSTSYKAHLPGKIHRSVKVSLRMRQEQGQIMQLLTQAVCFIAVACQVWICTGDTGNPPDLYKSRLDVVVSDDGFSCLIELCTSIVQPKRKRVVRPSCCQEGEKNIVVPSCSCSSCQVGCKSTKFSGAENTATEK